MIYIILRLLLVKKKTITRAGSYRPPRVVAGTPPWLAGEPPRARDSAASLSASTLRSSSGRPPVRHDQRAARPNGCRCRCRRRRAWPASAAAPTGGTAYSCDALPVLARRCSPSHRGRRGSTRCRLLAQIYVRGTSFWLAASGRAPPSPAILGFLSGAARNAATARRREGQPVARGRRRGRSLPAYLRRSRPHDCNRMVTRGLGVDGISFTVHIPWTVNRIPSASGSGRRRHRRQRAVLTSTAIPLALQTLRGSVPERQGGGAIGLLLRGQEGAVAAPRFGAPRRRQGHRPRGRSCCATRSYGCTPTGGTSRSCCRCVRRQ